MDKALQYLTTALSIIEARRQLGFPFVQEVAHYYDSLSRYFRGELIVTDEMWVEQQARKEAALNAWNAAKPGDINTTGLG